MLSYNVVINRLKNSSLFKDSFWAVFGNGIGNALMLLAGILIARFLGKDVYGEYGVVKSTMFYIASFATFGLGLTSTKYIAQYTAEQKRYIKSIMRDATIITLMFSSFIALLLLLFAKPLANYLQEPTLKIAFQALACIIVFRALTTTQIGLLAGCKEFKAIAHNSVKSGLFMLVICIPLTYFGGLKGSLLSLCLSQIFNVFVNQLSLHRITKKLTNQTSKDFKKELIIFSFPIALQESSYTVCHWLAVMLLVRFSSTGELGLYTAASQWNAIITMIPGLLSNVILSYLSENVSNKEQHSKTVKIMLLVNFTCTVIPFAVVYVLADFISGFYGETFIELPKLLRILTFATILDCCSLVFKSELMSQGRTWLLFSLRCVRDISLAVLVYIVLKYSNGENCAIYYAEVSVFISILFFVMMYVAYKVTYQYNGLRTCK